MQEQFLQLRSTYEFVSVFVTHDLLEALAIGTQIAVLHAGRLEAVTTPAEFFETRTPTALSFLNTLPPQLLAERSKWQT
jgi:ABC-type sulfate/molybdate transport systems ATPase subunit